jgi:hypothetical protein
MQLDTVSRLPKEQVFLNYLRCHDDIGWGLDYPVLRRWGMEEVPHKKYLNDYFRGWTGADARGELYNEDPVTGDARLCGTTASLCGLEGADKDTAIRKITMLHAMMLFQSGIPVLYSGDEIGQTNDWDYRLDPNKVQDSRYLHRGKMPWDQVAELEHPASSQAKIFRALGELERRAAEDMTVAFSMYPTSISELFAVSDAVNSSQVKFLLILLIVSYLYFCFPVFEYHPVAICKVLPCDSECLHRYQYRSCLKH